MRGNAEDAIDTEVWGANRARGLTCRGSPLPAFGPVNICTTLLFSYSSCEVGNRCLGWIRDGKTTAVYLPIVDMQMCL